MDTATDAKIRKAFATEIPGTTKIIIAQRISSIQDADRIIVMDNGKIDAFAPHEELLRTNEIYKEVYEAQTQTGAALDAWRRFISNSTISSALFNSSLFCSFTRFSPRTAACNLSWESASACCSAGRADNIGQFLQLLQCSGLTKV